MLHNLIQRVADVQDVAQHATVTQQGRDAVMRAVRARFPPEFLNRLDDTVIFEPLKQTALHTILGASLGCCMLCCAGNTCCAAPCSW